MAFPTDPTGDKANSQQNPSQVVSLGMPDYPKDQIFSAPAAARQFEFSHQRVFGFFLAAVRTAAARDRESQLAMTSGSSNASSGHDQYFMAMVSPLAS